jgi:hypothetical protein
MTRRVVLVLAFLVGAFGCNASEAFIPEGTVRITPPPEYRAWWEASRACVNKPELRRFDVIKWYVSPDILVSSDGVRAAALTIDNRVYVAALYQSTTWIIQHELVHAINGIRGHPDDPFLTCHLRTWQDAT